MDVVEQNLLASVKEDFPILQQEVHGKNLVYLDNAATTQKPVRVISAISHYYEKYNANVHRGVHYLSELATAQFEHARSRVKEFINAAHLEEIIFVRGTTEAINLVAQSYGRQKFVAGDEVILSELEHHSNIVPWQLLETQLGVKIRVIPVLDSGELDFDAYQQLFTSRTKMVSVNHVSNAIGTINPVADIIKVAHQHDVPVMLDGAQAVPHLSVDVQQLDVDFYAFSGHKMYGPTGIGVLYGKRDLLEAMPPYQGGGEMISQVSFTGTTFNALPAKFEAGTPNISGAVGLAAAIDYLTQHDMKAIRHVEQTLLYQATEQLREINGLTIIGQAKDKAPVISFVLDNIHPHDIGTVFDHEGVAIRAGHHCAMPLMQRFGLPATARASFAIYNTPQDIEALVAALHTVQKVFG